MSPQAGVKPMKDSKNELLKNGSLSRRQERAVLIDSDNPIEEDASKSSPINFLQMLRYAKSFDYLLLVVGVVFSAVYGVVPASNTIAFRGLTNTLITAQAQYTTDGIDLEWFTVELLKYIELYASIVVVSLISGYLSMYCLFMLCERQILQIRKHFFRSILGKNTEFFDQNEVGTLTYKISCGIDRIRDGTTDKIVLLISSTFSMTAGLSVSFYMSWQMGLVLVCIVPFVILNLVGSGFLVKSSIKRESGAYEKAGSLAEHVLNRIRTVLAFCGQQAELSRYASHLIDAHKHGKKKVLFSSLFTASFQTLLFWSMSVAFYHGTTLLMQEKVRPGDVVASFWAALGGAMRFGQALPHIAAIMSAKVAISEVFEIIDQEPVKPNRKEPNRKESNKNNGLLAPRIDGRVEFSNVSFSYQTRQTQKALGGVSFVVESGKTVALVGRSGAGKSSIANLLMKDYTPDEGSIEIDGIDLLDQSYSNNSIALVPQHPVVFSLTIEENLKLGRSNITDDDMLAACKLANAYEFIKKLPMEFKTPIANGQLSGGQAQRLTIARALLSNPKILIFDESTSYLDPHSEKLIQSAIEKIGSDKTIIVITHRLPVKHADKILVVNSGHIVETGTHQELMDKDEGVYRHLVEAYKTQGNREESPTDRERTSSQQSKSPSEPFSCSRRSLLTGSANDSDNSSDLDEEEKLTERVKAKKKTTIGRILRYARPEYKFFLPGFLFTLLRGCSWPLFSIIYGRFFKSLSDVLVDKSSGMPLKIFAELLTLGSVAGTFTFLSGYFLGISGEKMAKRMRYQVFEKLLYMDGYFFDNPKNSVGKLTSHLSTDASSVSAAVDQRLADVLQGIVALVVGINIAFFFDYKMAAFGLFMPVLVVTLQLYLTNALKRRIRKDMESTEEAAKIVSEATLHIRTIRSMNVQKYFYDLYSASVERLYDKSRTRAKIQAISFGLMGAYFSLNFSTAYLIGLFLIRGGYSSPFSVFQSIESTNMGAFSLVMVASFVSDYLRARIAGHSIFKLLDLEPKIDSSSTQGLRPKINGNISFKEVCFAYPQNTACLVLNNLNITIKQGKTIALVGQSGCGKSTTVQLLERFYDVISGSIKIDGVDVRQINIQHLRRHIGLVEQNPSLLNLSVAENIAYGRPTATLDEIVEAAKRANIHSFIESLPNGYNTLIGKEGVFSGGQTQRIALSRLFLMKPSILILDEANSSVDLRNERIIQEALESETKNKDRTCIVITHRLNSIKNVDLVAVISEGRIKEIGSPEELLKLGGLFTTLSDQMNSE